MMDLVGVKRMDGRGQCFQQKSLDRDEMIQKDHHGMGGDTGNSGVSQ